MSLLINDQDWIKFLELRELLFTSITLMLAEDGHHKSYEGRLSIELPGYFDDGEVVICLSCYLVCNGRHETWAGSSFTEALDKCYKDLWPRLQGIIKDYSNE